MQQTGISFLRYPGGKQRLLDYLIDYLPDPATIEGCFVEPFVGGGAVFFALEPRRAVLSDINDELINLYRGIRRAPAEVWELYRDFPATKKAYYQIRNSPPPNTRLAGKAARTLYLNRTCFKGMWRHNANGDFNVGYGGQARRWVITSTILIEVSKRLRRASLTSCDFESVIDDCVQGDFIFADPPYCPGEAEIRHSHYVHSKFCLTDHKRLAQALKRASRRGVAWTMTTSSHPDILHLFRGNRVVPLLRGTGNKPGLLTDNSGEVILTNH